MRTDETTGTGLDEDDGSDLAGGLDDLDPVQDLSQDLPRPGSRGPAVGEIAIPDLDRYKDENWRRMARACAGLEAIANSPRTAAKDRVSAFRALGSVAHTMIVLVGLDKTGEGQGAGEAARSAAHKAAARDLTLSLFGVEKPTAPPPFVTKPGETIAVRGT